MNSHLLHLKPYKLLKKVDLEAESLPLSAT
jgi:hypothetical protein